MITLSGCNVIADLNSNCRTKIEKTENGNFVFCALCDSVTFSKLIKPTK